MKGKKIGIYNPYIETRGGGEKVTAVVAEYLSKDNDVSLIVWDTKEPLDISQIEKYFAVDLSRVKVVPMKSHNLLVRVFTTRLLPWPERFRQLAASYSDYKKMKKMGFDVFINNLYQNSSPNMAPFGIYMCMFPQKLEFKKSRRGLIYDTYSYMISILERILLGDKKTAIHSYNLITANSKFTQRWIKKYWKEDSSVVYPICENMYEPGVQKRKIILNVGRFFALNEENHHKRQDVMLEVFSKMKRAHEDGWELHFAGSTAADADSLQFCVDLTQKAEGLPIFFHFNYPYPKLRKLFNEASIYWHATGYGYDQEKFPEKQEHFGITTVEAMSAGAVPVVINTGGQPESVIDGKNGYLWSDLNQLESMTIDLIKNQGELTQLSKNAQIAAKKFDKSSFKDRLDEIFMEKP